MMRIVFMTTVISLILPVMANAEIYGWIDSNGITNYTSNPKNLPEYMQKSCVFDTPLESPPLPSDKKAKTDENARRFIKETIDKINVITQQIEQGVRHVDEYFEKSIPVSKNVLVSYLINMAYEINNLKSMNLASKDNQAKTSLETQIKSFEKKYSEYNSVINDFNSIEVTGFRSETQIDYSTQLIVDPYTLATYLNPIIIAKNVDAFNRVIYTIAEEKYIYVFSATVSNSGSRADVTIELGAQNYRGVQVNSHVIRTSIDSNSNKDIGDRIVLSRIAAQDINRWDISNVRIVRNRK